MKAIIEIEVPDYQIGQEVSIYFKDTMMIKGIVQEPKTGHWIITYPHGKQNPIYECPRCHASNSSVFKNYCPNCGKKMEV